MHLGLLTASVFAQESKIVIPQFAAGSAGGLRIETTVTLVNLSTEVLNPARATVRTFGPDGSPLAMLRRSTLGGVEAADTVQREIPGRGVAVVESYAAGGLLVGWLEVTTEDNLAVEVLYKIFDGTGNLLTVTSILPRTAVDSATLLISLAPGAGLASTVAVVNPSENNEEAAVDIVVYDEFGNRVAAGGFSLPAGSQLARSWPELVPELNGFPSFLGSAEITSNVPLNWLALQQEGVQLSSRDGLPPR
ncbi:MAG: hypothetical protein Kow00109_26230 [Acidobacteriota bacterium]